MHFILQAGERGSIAVGVKLIVQLEHHAQGVLGTRERLKMPCALSKKVTALDDLKAQIRHVAQLGDVRSKFENFAGVQKRCRFSRRSPVCRIYWFRWRFRLRK